MNQPIEININPFFQEIGFGFTHYKQCDLHGAYPFVRFYIAVNLQKLKRTGYFLNICTYFDCLIVLAKIGKVDKSNDVTYFYVNSTLNILG